MAQQKAETAKFMAVGEPFAFRVSKDIEGQNDGKLFFGTDKATEVTNWTRIESVRVRNDDGTLEEQPREYAVDAVQRCREYCVTGRLTEIKDDVKGVQTLSPEKAQAEAEKPPEERAAEARAAKKGR